MYDKKSYNHYLFETSAETFGLLAVPVRAEKKSVSRFDKYL